MIEKIAAVIWGKIVALAEGLWARFGDFNTYVDELGGVETRYFIYILLALVGLMVISRAIKVSFAIVQRIVLPAALVAWAVGSLTEIPYLAVFTVVVGLAAAFVLFRPSPRRA